MPKNGELVPESSNPQNVSQARPIENFWGDLALRVYDNGCQAKIVAHPIARIKLRQKSFDQKYLQNHMRGVKTKFRKIADESVFSLFENFSIKDNKFIFNMKKIYQIIFFIS